MRRAGHSRALGACILLALLAAEPPATAAKSPDEATLLAAANRRWRGARTQTRMLLELKKGRGKDGWTDCKWIRGVDRGDVQAQVRVSGADAIRRRFGDTIPIGTELVTIGWGVKKPGGRVILELDLQELPVRAKVHFSILHGMGFAGAGKIAEVERWARFEFLEMMSSGDEVLVDAPAPATAAAIGLPTPTRASTSDPVGAPPPVPPVSESASVGLRVLGATVEPLRIAPGGEIELVVTYSVDGAPDAREVEVLERRILLREGQELTTLQATISRQAGTHESRQPLRTPADLAEGVYELRAIVEVGGAMAEGSAIFQVTAPDD